MILRYRTVRDIKGIGSFLEMEDGSTVIVRRPLESKTPFVPISEQRWAELERVGGRKKFNADQRKLIEWILRVYMSDMQHLTAGERLKQQKTAIEAIQKKNKNLHSLKQPLKVLFDDS